MATLIRTEKPRRRLGERELTHAGFTCRLAQGGTTSCARVLWEDDRLGRITEIVELPIRQTRVIVEIPAGRTTSGQVHWAPLDTLAGAQSDAVQRLLPILKAMAADVYDRTLPLREVEPFELDEEHDRGVM